MRHYIPDGAHPMRYEVEGNDLCIRIPLDAIASQTYWSNVVAAVKDKQALALSVGRELCECEDMGGDYYLSRVLDDALVRVIESADKSLQYKDEDETA